MNKIIHRIDNGDLHTTRFYDSSKEPDSKDDNSKQLANFQTYCSILDFVGDGFVTGDRDGSGKDTHYDNLRLTKSGNNLLRWGNLTLKDIDNSYGKNSIKEWLLKPLVVAFLTVCVTAPTTLTIQKLLTRKPETQLCAQCKNTKTQAGTNTQKPPKNVSNQRVEPTVKTSVGSGNVVSTEAHP